MNYPRILGLIPARGGSKGIPGKNIKLLGGIPLIEHSISAALKVSQLDQTVVSTDDSKIASVSKEAGALTPFIRPAELATDSSPTIETIKHSLLFFMNEGVQFDAVCLLQPTVPFRHAQDIEDAISLFISHDVDAVISVKKVPHQFNPHWTFVKNSQSELLEIATGDDEIITRRQDLPTAYYRDGSIYIIKSEVILNQNSLFGEKLLAYENKYPTDINLDTLEDWKKAEDYLHGKEN